MENLAIALLANSITTGAGLYTLICILGPLSGGKGTYSSDSF